MPEYTRRVRERGQVTIPAKLRDRLGIRGGDELVFKLRGDEIVIEAPTDEDRLGEGYRAHADRSRDLAAEMDVASIEADERIGDAPSWKE